MELTSDQLTPLIYLLGNVAQLLKQVENNEAVSTKEARQLRQIVEGAADGFRKEFPEDNPPPDFSRN
jgi:hypothetical protein